MQEKSKFNKFMNVVFVIIFICALAYAAYYMAIVKYDLLHTKEKAVQEILAQNQDEEKEVVSKKVGECKAPGLDEPLIDWNRNAFQNVLSERGKYIYMHYENEKVEFWSLSKDEMQKKLNKLEPVGEYTVAIKDVDEMDEMAVALLINLGNYDFLHRKDKKEWLLNPSGNIKCLDNLCFDGAQPGKGPQKTMIPRLSFDNVKVETSFISWDGCNIGAIISADVTCKKMTELGEKLDWVPDEGKTERVTFIINYYVLNIYELQNTDIICLDNMDILN